MSRPNKNVFKEITNNDIYEMLLEVKDNIKETHSKINLNRKWLYGLSVILLAVLSWALSFNFGG